MKTKKLYQQDPYLTFADGSVLEVISDIEMLKLMGFKKKERGILAVFDQTVFFPTGGGQPCDLGTVSVDNSVDYSVLDVFERDGTVYHRLNTEDGLAPGQSVNMRIDWPRRFSHMQRHCGEHILSGAFDRLFGGVNRGFRMGEEEITIDISLEKNPAFTELTWDMAMEAERFANQIIWRDEPISVHFFETREEAETMPTRKPLSIQRDVSVVCVGDPTDPSDCVACCGTHPSSAGQVGLIKILKLEHYKGMARLYLKVGEQALKDYGKKHDLIAALSVKHSAEPEKLLPVLEKQEQRNQQIRQELAELKQTIAQRAFQTIQRFYEAPVNWNQAASSKKTAASSRPASSENTAASSRPASSEKTTASCEKSAALPGDPNALRRISSDGSPILIARKSFTDLKSDDLQTLGRKCSPFINGLMILIAQKEHTALLFSCGQPDCGKLVRENASICQGKGGGNETCARAIFSSDENLETYVDLIEKHLR